MEGQGSSTDMWGGTNVQSTDTEDKVTRADSVPPAARGFRFEYTVEIAHLRRTRNTAGQQEDGHFTRDPH